MNRNYDVAIAGELNLDLILYGLPGEMPTERELLGTDFVSTLGSSSAIVAHNLAVLGARVAFQSVVGEDDFGALALQRLSAGGVDVSRVQRRAGRKTGVTVLLPHGGERHILTYPGTIADLRVTDLDFEQLASARHFHLSSLYLQQNLHTGLADLLRKLREAGLTLSLDTNDDPSDQWGSPLLEILPHVDILMPNESELCRMFKADDVETAVGRAREQVATVVVKRGSKGALLATDEGTQTIVPLKLERVVDTIGAGDSFDAGFLRAYLNGHDLASAARAGNIAGALSTQGHGGTEAFRDAAVRERFLRENDPDGLLSAAPGSTGKTK